MAALLAVAGCECGADGDRSATKIDPAARETPRESDVPDLHLFPDAFRIVMMRGKAPDPPVEGNSLDALEAALEQGIEYVEVDFLSSADGTLVSTHGPELGGDCGHVRKTTLEQLRTCRLSGGRRIATLEDLLRFPFEEVYVDLKDSGKGSDERILEATETAIAAIEEAGREDDAFVMLYRVPDEVGRLLRDRGIRAGTKGYPSSEEETRELIDLAADQGMEMMCIPARRLTPELLLYSARQGIWQLPWDYARAKYVDRWQSLARSGMAGLIITDADLIQQNVVPHWRDVRSILKQSSARQARGSGPAGSHRE